jgi:hypothetical protein
MAICVAARAGTTTIGSAMAELVNSRNGKAQRSTHRGNCVIRIEAGLNQAIPARGTLLNI